MQKYLIINADDYGHTNGISAGIRLAHLKGLVSSTTAMMNRPQALNAVRYAQKECPSLGIGVHLVLTVGKPILSKRAIPSLVNEEGNFIGLAQLTEKLEKINLDEVEAEWRAQIDLFSSSGRTPDHLDAHHHCAYLSPELFERFLKLSKELNCPIREPFDRNIRDFAYYLSPETAHEYENKITTLNQRYLPKFPQIFFGNFYDEGATVDQIEKILEQVHADREHSSFEIMCHPAFSDDELRNISDYSDKREVELEILQRNEIKERLNELEIKLIRFSDL